MMTDLTAFEAALEEAMSLLEQGQEMNRERFDSLIAQLSERVEEAPGPDTVDDPRMVQARLLMQRANALERSAAEGHGEMDEVNSLLSPLMGKKSG